MILKLEHGKWVQLVPILWGTGWGHTCGFLELRIQQELEHLRFTHVSGISARLAAMAGAGWTALSLGII